MPRPRGTGSLYQRKESTVWWIKYHRNGSYFRESTRTADKRKATRILSQRLSGNQQWFTCRTCTRADHRR